VLKVTDDPGDPQGRLATQKVPTSRGGFFAEVLPFCFLGKEEAFILSHESLFLPFKASLKSIAIYFKSTEVLLLIEIVIPPLFRLVCRRILRKTSEHQKLGLTFLGAEGSIYRYSCNGLHSLRASITARKLSLSHRRRAFDS